MLKGLFQQATFTNVEVLRAVLSMKPGSMVIVLDHSHADLFAGFAVEGTRLALAPDVRVPTL